MSDVVLKNIKKVYEQNSVAVKNFNLEISDKEFVVLVGPSGCGKSTTLRMIAGLEDISEGDIFINGKRVNHINPKDRNIAMVFQNYALYPHMTVYDNLAFSLKLRKMNKKDIENKVMQTAEILDIKELLQRKPKALSGGQKQRVAIGRAIVREPQVFLMDEPLSNLDAKLRNQMRAEIMKLRKRIDTTFIYVTHDQTEAMTLGDRIVIMKDGIIQQIGTPQNVFNHPANMFVAGFIGTPQMNFFNARLELPDHHYYVAMGNMRLPLSQDTNEKFKSRQQGIGNIIIGVRPEHIKVVPEGTPDAVKALVDVFEIMGSEVYLHTNFEEQSVIIRMQATEMAELNIKPGYQEEVNFILSNNLMHIFDAETKLSLLD